MKKSIKERMDNNYFWTPINQCTLEPGSQILCLFVHPTNSHLSNVNPFMLATTSSSPALIINYWPEFKHHYLELNHNITIKKLLNYPGIKLKTLHFNSFDIADSIFFGQHLFKHIFIFIQNWTHQGSTEFLIDHINIYFQHLQINKKQWYSEEEEMTEKNNTIILTSTLS